MSGKADPPKTTVAALVESYLVSPAYMRLKPRTRAEYRRTLDLIRSKNGDRDFRKMRRRDVIAARDAYASTWRKANSVVEMISILAKHAIDLEWITDNPAAGVEKLKGGAYEAWPDAKLNSFVRYCEAHGETVALTAYHLGVGTGQRLSDCLAMKWADFDGEYISVVQEKTGAKLDVACPSRLRSYLDALPKRGDYILAKNLREHLSKSQVQKAVSRVRAAIGAEDYVIHGWRYTAARELAEAGCSDSEIASVTGHKSLAMVQKYRRQASQRRMSKSAQERRK